MNGLSGDQVIETGIKENYELIRKLGSGKYGEVFEAFNVTNNSRCAIKVLKPIRKEKVLREIKVLQKLQNGTNIIKLKDIIINGGNPCLVFRYISDQTLKTVSMDLNELEIKNYLFKLLRAIDFAHNYGVIHRDIKPSNILIDRKHNILKLIDWGLAEFHSPDKIYSVTVASRFYKSPELLLNNCKYDYSLDIWSLGCIVAGLIFKREPFFAGLDNLDQLKIICNVFGTKCLKKYIKKYELRNLPPIKCLLEPELSQKSWKELTIFGNENLINEVSLDFVDKLLVFDHKHRLTASEALSHPFFDGLKARKIK